MQEVQWCFWVLKQDVKTNNNATTKDREPIDFIVCYIGEFVGTEDKHCNHRITNGNNTQKLYIVTLKIMSIYEKTWVIT